MEINIFFIVIIITCVYLLTFNISKIIYFYLFFSPYTASSLINIDNYSINISTFIGGFILLKYFYLKLRRKDIKIVKIERSLLIFLISVIFSIFGPLYVDKNIILRSSKGLIEKYESISNLITLFHIFYILYFVSIYIVIKDLYYNQIITLNKILKIYYISFYSIVLYIILEKIALVTNNFDIFNKILRMDTSVAFQNYRLSGPNLEPSVLSIYLIFSFGVFYFNGYKREALITLILGFFSTASTFILGIIFYCLLFLYRKQKQEIFKIIILLFISISFLLIYLKYFNENAIIHFTSFTNKIMGGGVSGSTRSKLIYDNFKIFLKYPLFGIGYGKILSNGLISNLSTTIGLMGTIAYIYYSLVNISLKKVKNRNQIALKYSIIISQLLLLLIVQVIYIPYIWFFMAIFNGEKKK